METATFFKRDFEENGSMERVTLFLNLVSLKETFFFVVVDHELCTHLEEYFVTFVLYCCLSLCYSLWIAGIHYFGV